MKTPVRLTSTLSYPSFDELKKQQSAKRLRDLSSTPEKTQPVAEIEEREEREATSIRYDLLVKSRTVQPTTGN